MKPNFSPDQNPFASIMAGAGQPGAMQTPQQQGPTPMPGGPQPGGPQQPGQPIPPQGPMGMQKPEPSVLERGQTGDATKPLLMAVQNLHAYMAMVTQPQEVTAIRNIISMLVNIISRDQAQAAQAPQNQPGGPAAPQGPVNVSSSQAPIQGPQG